jgi:hypothetical protein
MQFSLETVIVILVLASTLVNLIASTAMVVLLIRMQDQLKNLMKFEDSIDKLRESIVAQTRLLEYLGQRNS